MKKQPSCTQILAALETKERDLKGAPLDPNEFATTKQLLEYIATFDNLSEACKGLDTSYPSLPPSSAHQYG